MSSSQSDPPVTPPKETSSTRPASGTTPRVAKSSHQAEHSSMTLEENRSHIIRATRGNVVQVSHEFFAKSVLREIDDATIDKVHDHLLTKNIIDKGTGRWTKFMNKNPSDFSRKDYAEEIRALADAKAAKTQAKKGAQIAARKRKEGMSGAEDDSEPQFSDIDDNMDPFSATGPQEQTENKTRSLLENLIFGDLADIYTSICESSIACDVASSSIIKFRNRPNDTKWSGQLNGNVKPDGGGVLCHTLDPRPKSQQELSYLPDHVCVEEYKQKDEVAGRNDNVRKLLSNATHILQADAGRRFVFGTTIEDTKTRFWFFSCSHILVTEPFNFVQEPRTLIRFIMSQAFANKEELGYDSTVVRSWENNSLCFIYTINDRRFKTIEALDTSRTAIILTRATRVWRAIEIDPEGNQIGTEEYALKDVWLSTDSKLEAEILKDIEDKLDTKNPGYFPSTEAAKDVFETAFLIVEECGTVPSVHSKDDEGAALSYSSEIYTRGQILPDGAVLKGYQLEERVMLLSPPPGSAPKHGKQDAPTERPLPPRLSDEMVIDPTKYEHKKHVRVVFKGVGEDLYHASNIHEVLTAVVDASLGLSCMFSAGYVHRDVSPGNIIIHEVDGKRLASLSDLEYAKTFTDANDRAIHAPKTGTWYFTSVEVTHGHYLFLPQPEKKKLKQTFSFMKAHLKTLADEKATLDSSATAEEHPLSNAGLEIEEPKLVQHYLHDMESLLWIVVWFFFRLPAIVSAKAKVEQSRRDLFPPDTAPLASRQNFILNAHDFKRHMGTMKLSDDPGSLVQQQVRTLVEQLNNVREGIINGYTEVSKLAGFPCEDDSFSINCNYVNQMFDEASKTAQKLCDSLNSILVDGMKVPQWAPEKRTHRIRPRSKIDAVETGSNKKSKTNDGSAVASGSSTKGN